MLLMHMKVSFCTLEYTRDVTVLQGSIMKRSDAATEISFNGLSDRTLQLLWFLCFDDFQSTAEQSLVTSFAPTLQQLPE